MPRGREPCRASLIFLVVLAGSVLTKSAWAGTSCSCGGSTIIFPGQTRPFLLDRLDFNPGLANRQNPAPLASTDLPSIPPGRQPELGPLLASDQKAFAIARERLHKWEKYFYITNQRESLLLVAQIEYAMDHMSYLRTTHTFSIPPSFELEPKLRARHPTVSAAILYTPKFGAIISGPAWDAADHETQAGLLIHESMRQLQGGFEGLSGVTDRNIQDITALIMDSDPRSLTSFMSQHLLVDLAGVSRTLPVNLGFAYDRATHGVCLETLLQSNPILKFLTFVEQVIDASQRVNGQQLMLETASPDARNRLSRELESALIPRSVANRHR